MTTPRASWEKNHGRPDVDADKAISAVPAAVKQAVINKAFTLFDLKPLY